MYKFAGTPSFLFMQVRKSTCCSKSNPHSCNPVNWCVNPTSLACQRFKKIKQAKCFSVSQQNLTSNKSMQKQIFESVADNSINLSKCTTILYGKKRKMHFSN